MELLVSDEVVVAMPMFSYTAGPLYVFGGGGWNDDDDKNLVAELEPFKLKLLLESVSVPRLLSKLQKALR